MTENNAKKDKKIQKEIRNSIDVELNESIENSIDIDTYQAQSPDAPKKKSKNRNER